MEPLGYLMWWRVMNTASLTHDQAAAIGVPVPERPIPIDVFRRITGSRDAVVKHQVGEEELELSLVAVDSPSEKLVVRHIVATMRGPGGMVTSSRKVGDVAFYKPPRGQNSKARMKVALDAPASWNGEATQYAAALREAYALGIAGVVDHTAIRRIIRNHLAKVEALSMEGPYLVAEREDVEPLEPLFNLLGDSGVFHVVPMPSSPQDCAFVMEAMTAAVKLGIYVSPVLWARLEANR